MTSSAKSLGRLILLADLASLPDELLQRVVREASRPLPEIRAANVAFLERARPALGAVSDLGLQGLLSEAAEASAMFICAHERILPYQGLIFQLEGEALQALAQATRIAAFSAQILRDRSIRLASAMESAIQMSD